MRRKGRKFALGASFVRKTLAFSGQVSASQGASESTVLRVGSRSAQRAVRPEDPTGCELLRGAGVQAS